VTPFLAHPVCGNILSMCQYFSQSSFGFIVALPHVHFLNVPVDSYLRIPMHDCVCMLYNFDVLCCFGVLSDINVSFFATVPRRLAGSR